jgi:hypothetical protein
VDRLSSELLGFAPDARVLIVNCDDFTELAIDPSPLFATCSRNMDVPIYREMRRRTLRSIRKWAAKRLRELHATEAVPSLAASLGSVDLRHSLRLRRTIQSLRRSTDSHPSDTR